MLRMDAFWGGGIPLELPKGLPQSSATTSENAPARGLHSRSIRRRIKAFQALSDELWAS